MSFKKKDSLRGFKFYANVSQSDINLLVPQDITDAPETMDTVESEIPIFREGTFSHPWYGELVFDRPYLEKIVENHKRKVVPQQVSFDKDHNPGEGALAWVKDDLSLSIKDTAMPDGRTVATLFAKIEYTPEGVEEVLTKKKFKYFSSEIHQDYTNYEMITDVNGDRTVVYHGPTLIGGGFTNRPFIPNLGTVFSTSEDGSQVEQSLVMVMSESEEGSAAFGTIAGIAIQEPPTPQKIEEEPQTIEEKGETKMKFSELLKAALQFSGPQRNEFILSKVNELDEDDKELAQSFVETQEKIELSNKVAQEATRKAELAAAKLAEKEQQIVALSTQVLEAKQQSYQSRVNAFSEKLKADMFAPAVADEVKNILLSLDVDSRSFKFSVDGSQEKVDFVDILTQIFSKFPEDLRVPTSATFSTESAEENKTQEPATETKSAEELELERRVQLFTAQFGEAPTKDQINLLNEDGVIDFKKLNTKGE